MKYTKPYLSTPEHINLMRSRGLEIKDESLASEWLETVGYYRLTGYGLHLRVKTTAKKLDENFIPGSTFEQIISLYEFDRQLRLLILDAIERYEVSFRTRISNTMAKSHGPHWFLKHALFKKTLNKWGKLHFDPEDFIEAAEKHSKTLSIRHYNETYTQPYCPPSWMLTEVGTLGLWSRSYSELSNRSDQKPITDWFRLPLLELISFSRAINDLRNKCAHHARVWDIRFPQGPQATGVLKRVIQDNQTLFSQIAALIYCLWIIDPKTKWLDRLETLINESPPEARLNLMGFPPNWKELLIRLSATCPLAAPKPS